MRQAICYISLCAIGFALSGCGQSGALQLQSDPNFDSRAKYLLHSATQAPKKTEENNEIDPVQSPAEVENSNSTP